MQAAIKNVKFLSPQPFYFNCANKPGHDHQAVHLTKTSHLPLVTPLKPVVNCNAKRVVQNTKITMDLDDDYITSLLEELSHEIPPIF